MAVSLDGIPLTTLQLKSSLLVGGDVRTQIVPGTDIYPATRGLHTLMAYLAPLDRYYDEWAGRVHGAIGDSIGTWRDVNAATTQRSEIDAQVATIAPDVTSSFAAAQGGIDMWRFSVYATPVHGESLRMALENALATVDVAALAIRRGQDLYFAKVTDLAATHDKFYAIHAEQGATAARTVGNAVQYTGQALDVKNRGRMLAVDTAQFNANKEVEDAQRRASESGDTWGAIGNVIGIASALF